MTELVLLLAAMTTATLILGGLFWLALHWPLNRTHEDHRRDQDRAQGTDRTHDGGEWGDDLFRNEDRLPAPYRPVRPVPSKEQTA